MSSLGQANPVELPNNVFPDPGYRDPRGDPQTPPPNELWEVPYRAAAAGDSSDPMLGV